MTTAIEFRCLNHPEREAAARCPRCRRYFCRECVAEYRGRMLCAECMAGPAEQGGRRHAFMVRTGRLAVAVLGLLILWLTFQYYGHHLATLPDASPGRALLQGDTLGRLDNGRQ